MAFAVAVVGTAAVGLSACSGATAPESMGGDPASPQASVTQGPTDLDTGDTGHTGTKDSGKTPAGETQGEGSEPGKTNPQGLQPVPSRQQQSNPPVPIDRPARFNPGVTVRVLRSTPVRLRAEGRGEIEGPGVRMDLVIHNGTDAPIDLSLVNVTMTYGPNDTPATAGPAVMERPFTGRLAAGGKQRASYVFGVPVGQRDQVRLMVSYTADQPVAVLTGPVG